MGLFRVLYLILVLSLFVGSRSFAKRPWQWDLHAEMELDATNYFATQNPTNQLLLTDRVLFDGVAKYGKQFRIKVSPLLQADPLNNSSSERYWADLPNGYAQYTWSGFTLQAGYNTFNWGVTDGYNPLDATSARRYQDPFKADKLGAPSIDLKKSFGNVTLEGLYIPFQRKSILPGENSRWLPREIFSVPAVGSGGDYTTLILPSTLTYHFSEGRELDRALENNFGARIQVQGVVEGLDLTVEGFEGAGGTPATHVTQVSGNLISFPPNTVIQANPLIGVEPVYYRQRVYGGSLVYTNFGMIFRAEAAFTRLISKSSYLPGDSEEFVFGVEKPLAVWSRDLTLLLGGTYAHHSDLLSNSTTSLNRIFDRAIIMGARFSVSEKLTLLASMLYDSESKGELGHIDGIYSLSDEWKVGMSGDVFSGGAGTPIGTYRKNSRTTVMAKLAL